MLQFVTVAHTSTYLLTRTYPTSEGRLLVAIDINDVLTANDFRCNCRTWRTWAVRQLLLPHCAVTCL